MTFIFNHEYTEMGDKAKDANYIKIKCILPAPITLSVNNLNQLMEIVNQQAEQFSILEYPDEDDEAVNKKRNIYKQKYVKYKLGTYLKQNEMEIIKSQADFEYEVSYKKPKTDDSSSSY